MKNLSPQLKYSLSILLSVLSLLGVVGFAVLALSLLLDKNIPLFLLCALGALLCYIASRHLLDVRTSAREEAETDEFGGRKGNKYKNLSAKERRAIDLQTLAEREKVISSGELKRATHQGSKIPDEDLAALIGLRQIKEEVVKMKVKLEYDQKYKKSFTPQDDGRHMCFYGNPGTGKTTVARIMTGILFKYGCIKENKYVEVDASFLKGTTPDATLKRVRAVLHHASGGVLFIDEAYSLLSGINSSEIIAELVKYMEDHKKDFVLILAGYHNDMCKLIDSNPGLHSRISKYFLFNDYNIDELKDIFTAAAHKAGYCVDASAYERFEDEITKQKKGKNFGNARSVQNLFQKALEKHAYNSITENITDEKLYTITASDIEPERNKF